MTDIPFDRALHSYLKSGDCMFATVLEGAAEGSQLLLCGRTSVWQTGSPWSAEDVETLRSRTATGIVDLACGRVFAERFGAEPQLVVCGGGHVAVAVVRFAKLLGFPVTAIDDRAEFADDLRSAGADKVICRDFSGALEEMPGGAETYFVVVTRAHSFDLVCLEKILKKRAAYVGMMGSRGRAALVRRQLLEAGADPQRVEAIHAPIGLSIGAQTAEEIALSILAQIVEIRNARTQTEGFSTVILHAMEEAPPRQPMILATIVDRHGSTPRPIGAKMLVFPDGRTAGSIGGGIMEHRAILAAQEMLTVGSLQKLLFCTADGKNEDAAIAACGGSMELVLHRVERGEKME